MSDAMMAAGVFLGAGDIQCQQRPVPTPGAKDILVKVANAGICGTDMHIFHHGGFTPPGLVIGHEFSGEIVATGSEVTQLSEGQRVCVNPMPDLGLFSDGAFADYVCVKNAVLGGNVFSLPDAVSDEEGAMVEPLAVALHSVNRAKLDKGDRVIVTGAGTIGLSVLLVLKARGIEQVMMADMSPVRLALAEQLGAMTVNIAEHSLRQRAEQQFGVADGLVPAPAVDVIIDCTGSQAALQDAIDCVQVSGKIVIVGTYSGPVTLDLTLALAKELDIITSLAYGDEFGEALELISAKELDVTSLISHRFPLAEIDRAFIQQANSEQSIKVMLQI